MSTTTTPLLGLIKPDLQEPMPNWPWQNLLNSMLLDNKVKAQFLTYTPELTAITTDPTLGTGGVIEGKYIRLSNRLIIVFGRFRFGTSGIGVGSGNYQFSLPVAADDTLHNISAERAFDMVGRFVYRDNNSQSGSVLGSTEIDEGEAVVKFTYGYGTGDSVGSSNPFTPETEDALSFYGIYQEAAT